MEAFVNKIQGRTPQTWIEPQDTIDNMKWIEAIYAKVRPFVAFFFVTSQVDDMSLSRMDSEVALTRSTSSTKMKVKSRSDWNGWIFSRLITCIFWHSTLSGRDSNIFGSFRYPSILLLL